MDIKEETIKYSMENGQEMEQLEFDAILNDKSYKVEITETVLSQICEIFNLYFDRNNPIESLSYILSNKGVGFIIKEFINKYPQNKVININSHNYIV